MVVSLLTPDASTLCITPMIFDPSNVDARLSKYPYAKYSNMVVGPFCTIS